MAGKYTVLIPFHRVDPRTGETTEYNVGDVDKYLADPNIYAPDHGPLIAEKDSKPVQAPASQEK